MESPKNDYFEDLVNTLFLDFDYENAATSGVQSPLLSTDDFLSLGKIETPQEALGNASSLMTELKSNEEQERYPSKSPWTQIKRVVPAPAPVPMPQPQMFKTFANAPNTRTIVPAPAPIALPAMRQQSIVPAPAPIPLANKRSRAAMVSETSSLGDVDDLGQFTFDANTFQNDHMKSSAEVSAPHTKKTKTQSTDYKGVCFHPSYRRYRARIKINGKTTHLGYFETAYQAALAYDRAARELRGNSAVTNFPVEQYEIGGDVPNSPRSRCLAAARSVLDVNASQSPIIL